MINSYFLQNNYKKKTLFDIQNLIYKNKAFYFISYAIKEMFSLM